MMLVFEVGNSDALRVAMKRFASLDNGERQAVETQAEAWASRQTWDSFCEQLEQIMIANRKSVSVINR